MTEYLRYAVEYHESYIKHSTEFVFEQFNYQLG